jgi:hypothetical protein
MWGCCTTGTLLDWKREGGRERERGRDIGTLQLILSTRYHTCPTVNATISEQPNNVLVSVYNILKFLPLLSCISIFFV